MLKTTHEQQRQYGNRSNYVVISNHTTRVMPTRQVRARGANKGNFVHMVLGRLSWPVDGSATDTSAGDADANDGDGAVAAAAAPGGRFCLCVGDDVSDEDMFIAAKVQHCCRQE